MDIKTQFKNAQDRTLASLVAGMAALAAAFIPSNPKVSADDFTNYSRTRSETYRSLAPRAMKVSSNWSTVKDTNTFSINSSIGQSGKDAANTAQQANAVLFDAFYFAYNDDASLADIRKMQQLGVVTIRAKHDGFTDIVLQASDCFRNPLIQQATKTDVASDATTGTDAYGMNSRAGDGLWCPIPGGLGLLPNQIAEIEISGLGNEAISSTLTLQLHLRGTRAY